MLHTTYTGMGHNALEVKSRGLQHSRNDVGHTDVMLLVWYPIDYLKREGNAYCWALQFGKKTVVIAFASAKTDA